MIFWSNCFLSCVIYQKEQILHLVARKKITLSSTMTLVDSSVWNCFPCHKHPKCCCGEQLYLWNSLLEAFPAWHTKGFSWSVSLSRQDQLINPFINTVTVFCRRYTYNCNHCNTYQFGDFLKSRCNAECQQPKAKEFIHLINLVIVCCMPTLLGCSSE